MSAEKCSECGEPADKHGDKCWLSPRGRPLSGLEYFERPGEFRSRFIGRDGVMRDLTPEALFLDALAGALSDVIGSSEA